VHEHQVCFGVSQAQAHRKSASQEGRTRSASTVAGVTTPLLLSNVPSMSRSSTSTAARGARLAADVDVDGLALLLALLLLLRVRRAGGKGARGRRT
jgi:hypothetical protein